MLQESDILIQDREKKRDLFKSNKTGTHTNYSTVLVQNMFYISNIILTEYFGCNVIESTMVHLGKKASVTSMDVFALEGCN